MESVNSSRQPSGRVRASLALGWALICTALYAAVALIRFARMFPASYDNAIFEEAIRAYAHGGWPIVPIKGPGFNLLGDHFSPAIALVAPFYRLFPHAETLLVAQAVLIGISVYVVSSVAWRRLGWAWGVVVAVSYGLSFGLQSGAIAEFHEVAMGMPLIALAGSAFAEKRYRAVVGWSLPLLLVKEDLGLTIAAIGLALVVAGQRRRGILLALAGIAGSALEVLVLIPWANGSSYAYTLGGAGSTGALDNDLGRKALTLVLTLAVGGLIAVASPWALAAVPTLGWRFAADNPYYWGTDWHYSMILMPIMAVAAVDVMDRIRWTRGIAALAMAAVTGLSLVPNNVLGTPLTTHLQPSAWPPTHRSLAGEKVLAFIPRGATVSSDIGLITHLVSGGRIVTWVGTLPVKSAPEWVVLDHDPESNIGTPESAVDYAEQLYGVRYRVAFRASPFEVAHRVS